MKNILKMEEAALFAFSIFLFNETSFAWWWYPALLLVPDVGMVGYLVNTRVGALTYNISHHKGIAVVLYMIGWVAISEGIALAGIIMLGHASMDRVLGYGLKFPDSFKNTHLGKL